MSLVDSTCRDGDDDDDDEQSILVLTRLSSLTWLADGAVIGVSIVATNSWNLRLIDLFFFLAFV